MEVSIVDKKRLKAFINFPDELYADDDNYVPYMRADIKKTLTKLLFKDKTYCAVIVTDNGKILARTLFTIDKNKQLKSDKCGFFSMFECVNNQKVCNALFDKVTELMREQGADYITGTYFPYDQDNRRGILYQGFDRAPLIFTSYNKSYYNDLLENYGMTKQKDALEYTIDIASVDYPRWQKIANYSEQKYGFRVDTLNVNRIDDDIRDVQYVMERATNDIIYQDAPDIEALRSIVKQWKRYLNKDYILIARSNADNKPLGVAVALPDYFYVFKKMNGRTDLRGLMTFAKESKNIKSLRALMQYVLPEYQRSGVAVAIYKRMYEAILNNGITYMELGTVMENNPSGNSSILAMGGEVARIYRIYQKKI